MRFSLKSDILHSFLDRLTFISLNLIYLCSVASGDTSDYYTKDGAVELDRNNFDTVIKSTEFTFINFYANWCRFSQILEPIFNDAADNLKKEFTEPGRALLGRVDCDKQPEIAARYHISKYPTLKMFRNGEVQKREYRGQRSKESLTKFVQEQLKDPLQEYSSLEDLDKSEGKRKVIAFFEKKETPDYDVYKKVASTLRSECQFWIGFGEASRRERPGGNAIVFRQKGAQADVVYPGALQDYNLLFKWTQDKCIPLVREITFENAEELTEEGLPFLIMFHRPEDTASLEEYTKVIASELISEKSGINFLTADGVKFAHPLHHLGKSNKDLPLIAIDSFRHMYLFPKFEDLRKPGVLKQFIADLHSGKLHREFHQGPDPTKVPTPGIQDDDETATSRNEAKTKQVRQQIDVQLIMLQDNPADRTSPPESTFKKLAPSKTRYTLLRDEL